MNARSCIRFGLGVVLGCFALIGAQPALAQCPADGDCYTSNGSPGCDDESCCLGVCALDPFCCETNWDAICADQAVALCGPPCPSACLGDLDVNGIVNGADLGLLLGNWDGAGCGDLNIDGIVNGADLGLLLGNWGPCFTCPAPGDCCVEHGNPGCDNPACCEIVCANDPFCCDVMWDGICADEACELCGTLCGGIDCVCPAEGDCCVEHASPGCDNAACCEAVCSVDSFCCNLSWDDLCAWEAESLCGNLCPHLCFACAGGGGVVCDLPIGISGAFVQDCLDGQWVSLAYPIQTGGAPIDTITSVHTNNIAIGSIYICAGTCDGPDVGNILAVLCCAIEAEPADVPVTHCFPGVGTSAANPTWIVMVPHTSLAFDVAYDADTIGTVGASYANLDGGSAPSQWQDLNDFGFGDCYCVGLSFTGCDPPVYECPFTCPGDGDCCVSNGTPGCDDVSCCETVCNVDAFCCDVNWDSTCAAEACALCDPLCLSPCVCPGAGDCCENNGTPGCDDDACCLVVCDADPFCCNTNWDNLCASEACDLCDGLCPPTCICPAPGSCCEPHDTPGCEDASCCNIVCEQDSFCCETSWDSLCADEAVEFCNLC